MSNIRKNLLKVAGILTLVSAIVAFVSFIYIAFDIQGMKSIIVNDFVVKVNANEFTTRNISTIILIYLFASTVGNTLFGMVYLKYSKLDIYNFLVLRTKMHKVFIINLIVSLTFIPAIVAGVAIYLKPTKKELYELNLINMEIEKQIYFQNVIRKDEKLFSITMQINNLKRKLRNKEINETDYKQKLTEIIGNGVL